MRKTLGRLTLLLAFAGSAALAQESGATEAEIDALEPGLSTEDLTALDEARPQEVSTAEPAEAASEELAEVDPSVPSAVLAQDVRRRSVNNQVMDEIDLARTEITGNQELPKVLYIVPWQKSDPGDLTGKPVNSLLDDVLAPIDRSEFVRQVDYYGDLYGEEE